MKYVILGLLIFAGAFGLASFERHSRATLARDAIVAERAAIEDAFVAHYSACKDNVTDGNFTQCDAIADTYFSVRNDWTMRDFNPNR